MKYVVFYCLLIFLALIVHIRLGKLYLRLYFNNIKKEEGFEYDKKKERARFWTHLMGTFFIVLSLCIYHYNVISISYDETYKLPFLGEVSFNTHISITTIAVVSFFILGCVIILFCWTKKFESAYGVKELLRDSGTINTLQQYDATPEDEVRQKTLLIKRGIDTDSIIEQCIENQLIDKDSRIDFGLLLQNKQVVNEIIWIDNYENKSKLTNYRSLFDLLNDIIEGGFIAEKRKRKPYYDYVINNFTTNNGLRKSNISPRYSEWINKKKTK